MKSTQSHANTISLLVEIPEWLHHAIQEYLAQNPVDQDTLIAEALIQYLPQAR